MALLTELGRRLGGRFYRQGTPTELIRAVLIRLESKKGLAALWVR
jgi:hypothetical protein